MGLWDDTV